MSKLNLIGQKFGKLTVLEQDFDYIPKKGSRWKCVCSCGNIKSYYGRNLKVGDAKTCGSKNCRYPIHEEVCSIKNCNRLHYAKGFCNLHWKRNHKHGDPFKLIIDPNMVIGESNFNLVFYHYKRNAKKRKQEFYLHQEIFRTLLLGDCNYCGQSPSTVQKAPGTRGSFIYNGIDRIDSSLGYIENNCVSCCRTCNFAKGAMELEKFFDWVKRVYEHNN
jgi:hypothetical protein